MCACRPATVHPCHLLRLYQAVHALQVAETAQESRLLRERVANLSATNRVLVASIPNLSQRYKCVPPAGLTTPRPCQAYGELGLRACSDLAGACDREPCLQRTREASHFELHGVSHVDRQGG